VNLYDAIPKVAEDALIWVENVSIELHKAGLLRSSKSPEEVRNRVKTFTDINEAIKDVIWIQECVPEMVEHKRKVFEQLDTIAAPHVILASSSSAIPPSSFTSNMATKNRCIVAHPVNPPHLIPLVELVPAPYTDESVVKRAREIMEDVGQSPIVVKKEIDSFILNRLQGAVLNEAFRLVEDGYISPEDLDRTVKDGLGLRWSFMGPFETIDLNAPGGVADYITRYGGNMYALSKQQADPRPWQGQVVDTVTEARRSQIPVEKLVERGKWRDQRLMGLMSHKAQMEQSDRDGEKSQK